MAKIAILRQNIPISAGVESHRRNRPKGLPPREAKTAILQQTKPIRVGTNGDLPPRVAKTPCFGGKNCDPLTKQPHQCRGGRLWSLSYSPQENTGRMLGTTLPSDSRNFSLVRALGWGLRAVSKSLSFARSRDGGNHENPCPPELGKFKNPVDLCEGW